LVAHLLDVPTEPYYLINDPDFPGLWGAWYIPFPGEFYFVSNGLSDLSFPYGFNVEPDQP